MTGPVDPKTRPARDALARPAFGAIVIVRPERRRSAHRAFTSDASVRYRSGNVPRARRAGGAGVEVATSTTPDARIGQAVVTCPRARTSAGHRGAKKSGR